MKKWLAAVLSLLLLMVPGCQNPLKQTYSSPSEPVSDFPDPTLPTAVDSQTPPDQLLANAKECDIHAVVEKYFMSEHRYGNIYGTKRLAELAADLGMECVRQTDAGALYSVHKIKQGGRLYLFYFNQCEDYRVIRWFYVQKNLSHSDFAGIKEGSSIEDVKKIDPTTQIFENIYNGEKDYWKEMGGMMSWHYLTDGILEIGYDITDSEPKVMIMTYHEDYQIDQNDASIVRPYNGEILPIDRIE